MQLANGYICPSISEQISPIFFIPKKDGGKCLIQDYCHLNSGTVKNNYPLPLINDLVHQVRGCDLFTKMDLRWGYNNVCIAAGDEWKAAFVTLFRSYKPTVMFFGMCNAPATFQKMMNEIMSGLDYVIVYIDDLLIYTKNKTREKHDEIV